MTIKTLKKYWQKFNYFI